MATQVLRYVDPNSTAGGDGTTGALTGANRAYVSLNAAAAAEQKDLVAADQFIRFICSSDDAGATHVEDTTAVTIDGSTTDATRYFQIESASSHGGKWNDNIYRLNVQDGRALLISDNNVNLVGLQVSHHTLTAINDVVRIATVSAGATYLFDSCIFRMSGGDGTYVSYGVYVVDADATLNMINSLVYRPSANTSTANTAVYINLGNANVYSCTIIGGCRTFRLGTGTAVAKNCYVKVVTASYAYSATITLITCASSDTTGSAGLQNIAWDTSNFTNVSAGSEDFHLPVGSALIDVGTDTTGDGAPLNFTDDIDGVARAGTWDIGADEHISSTIITGPFPLFHPVVA